MFNRLSSDDGDYDNPLERDDLVDITGDTSPTLSLTAPGWRLSMVQASGEKILAESRTFNETVFFTSFAPGASASSCKAAAGTNRLYMVNVLDGSPVNNLDNSVDEEDLDETDRYYTLKQGGIAPEVAFIFPEGEDEVITCVGIECGDPGLISGPVRTFWSEIDPLAAN